MTPAGEEEKQPTKADEILRGIAETREELKGQGERIDTLSETLKGLQKPPQSPPNQQETPSHLPFGRYLDEHVLGDEGCPTCKKALKDRKDVISALFSEKKAPPQKPPAEPPKQPAEDKRWAASRLFSEKGESEK